MLLRGCLGVCEDCYGGLGIRRCIGNGLLVGMCLRSIVAKGGSWRVI